MAIKFACPKCKRELSLPDSAAGKSGKCKCGNQLKVPGATPVAAAKQSAAGKAAAATAAVAASPGMFDELAESDFARESPFEKVYSPSKTNNDASTLKRFTVADAEKKKKEAGAARGMLKLIGVLNLLEGIGCIVLAAILAAFASQVDKVVSYVPLMKLGLSLGVAFFSVAALVMLAGAIGLFLDKVWGWWLTAVASTFLVIERLATLGEVFANGFNQSAFFAAMMPLVGALLLMSFIFKGHTQQLLKIKSKVPAISAAVTGLVAAGIVLGAFYSMGSQ